MIKKLTWCLLFFGCGMAAAQVPQYDYFPAPLCQSDGVKIVSVYETRVDNPAVMAGHGNRIRLARNMVRQSYYNQEGLAYRSVWYVNEGKTVVTETVRSHNDHKLLVSDEQRHFNTNFADSTKLIQTNRRVLRYDPALRLQSVTSYLVGASATNAVDSVAYARDVLGRLTTEAVYSLAGKPTCNLIKDYNTSEKEIKVTTRVGEQVLNRDEFLIDAQGRVVKESNYGPGDQAPRLETTYVYDPRGWLEEVRSNPDWQHFVRDETVVSRKNKYDDHGKLVETQLDYGDGKRLFEFYDYTYWVED